jgi:hypothetical protein
MENGMEFMEKSSSELLEFGLDRARALSLFTASLNLGSSLELEPKLGPTSICKCIFWTFFHKRI